MDVMASTERAWTFEQHTVRSDYYYYLLCIWVPEKNVQRSDKKKERLYLFVLFSVHLANILLLT